MTHLNEPSSGDKNATLRLPDKPAADPKSRTGTLKPPSTITPTASEAGDVATSASAVSIGEVDIASDISPSHSNGVRPNEISPSAVPHPAHLPHGADPAISPQRGSFTSPASPPLRTPSTRSSQSQSTVVAVVESYGTPPAGNRRESLLSQNTSPVPRLDLTPLAPGASTVLETRLPVWGLAAEGGSSDSGNSERSESGVLREEGAIDDQNENPMRLESDVLAEEDPESLVEIVKIMQDRIQKLKGEKDRLWNQKELFRKANQTLLNSVCQTARERRSDNDFGGGMTPATARGASHRGSIASSTIGSPDSVDLQPQSHLNVIPTSIPSSLTPLQDEVVLEGGSPERPVTPGMYWSSTSRCTHETHPVNGSRSGSVTTRMVSEYETAHRRVCKERLSRLEIPGIMAGCLLDSFYRFNGKGSRLPEQPFNQWGIRTEGPIAIKVDGHDKYLSVKHRQGVVSLTENYHNLSSFLIHQRQFLGKNTKYGSFGDPFGDFTRPESALVAPKSDRKHWDLCLIQDMTERNLSERSSTGDWYLQLPSNDSPNTKMQCVQVTVQKRWWYFWQNQLGGSHVFMMESSKINGPRTVCLYHVETKNYTYVDVDTNSVSYTSSIGTATRFSLVPIKQVMEDMATKQIRDQVTIDQDEAPPAPASQIIQASSNTALLNSARRVRPLSGRTVEPNWSVPQIHQSAMGVPQTALRDCSPTADAMNHAVEQFVNDRPCARAQTHRAFGGKEIETVSVAETINSARVCHSQFFDNAEVFDLAGGSDDGDGSPQPVDFYGE
eukprot:GHVN01002287.1.p2 GENE.GHVN01002287.1~~GHVN01002287.1.p2  ORF type:complete len:782 (-),score=123.50 GHVN01002287.1:8211-10556(-)